MAAPRRKVTAEERKQRDALMRVINWAAVLVLRRLFNEGRTTDDVARLFDSVMRAASRISLARSTPNWQYVDEQQVADEVYATVTKGGE